MTEDKLKLLIAELVYKKKKLTFNIGKGLKYEQSTLIKMLNCKIEDGLVLKLITSVSVIKVGIRKYKLHINYIFKN